MIVRGGFLYGLALCALSFCFVANGRAQSLEPLSDELRESLEAELRLQSKSLAALRDHSSSDRSDVAIFSKGLKWALKYDHEFSPADIVLLKKAAVRGAERLAALSANRSNWNNRRGKLALGYTSRVDDSVQPYGLIVPKNYDTTKPMRLDVVLHGSTRPVGMSELRFIARFDEGDAANGSLPEQPFIELHPLGRIENCYRWAGETDVFEAIEDVCRRYNIDRDRIVLRGMSMGASGTWHLGLKHPDRFTALGPYCGYVDTHRFSETPLPNFVRVGTLPEHQELGLHMLDSVDYAANAGTVPAIACMGEKDIFFQAHVIMDEAMKREGLTMVNLISPGTGHKIDPVTLAEQMRQIGEYTEKGIQRRPNEMRFVTWTLKYNHCHWLQITGLNKHYTRAEFSAIVRNDTLHIGKRINISSYHIDTSLLPEEVKFIDAGNGAIPVPAKTNAAHSNAKESLTGKRPGLQGPIDDAFCSPFLCVRGTGRPWNEAAQQYADNSLKRFAEEWHHYFRGDLPVKDDTDVTADDVRTRNLILFGDPGSNAWIAKMLPKLPFTWDKERIGRDSTFYSSANHVPALIVASPLPGASERYLVLNSGHTFHEAELSKLNYLLFPRWGDWAVLRFATNKSEPGALEHVVDAGFFDEQWELPKK